MLTPKAYSYIRMSTDIQLKGDSLNRQLRLSEAYAAENGLDLVTGDYQDLGVSAYTSDNLRFGGLGRFMQAVKDGRVPQGSYLLVESLDRLSRAQPLVALGLFQEIVNLGITIVTLSDRDTYSKASINAEPYQLLKSILTMMRAHEESEMKSKRIGAAWDTKRRQLDQRKMTRMCPHWLELTMDRTSFKIHVDRAALVNEIFQRTIDGQGSEMIAKNLNALEIECWGRTKGWRSSYIKKLLINRAVLGELTTHKFIDGVRTPLDIVEAYYPAIVTSALFYTAESARRLRRGKGGRKGTQLANLFAGLSKCGYCGGPAHLKDRGPKSGKYLICDRAHRGIGCVGTGFPYEALESTFLDVAHEIELEALLATEELQSEVTEKKDQLEMLDADYSDAEVKLSRLLSIAVTTANPPRTIVSQMNELEDTQRTIGEDIAKLKQELSVLQMAPETAKHSLDEAKALVTQLHALEGDERLDVRTRLQQRIRAIVRQIDVYPRGQSPLVDERISRLKEFLAANEPNPSMAAKITAHSRATVTTERQYLIHFKSGRYCVITLSPKAPFTWVWKFDTETFDTAETVREQAT